MIGVEETKDLCINASKILSSFFFIICILFGIKALYPVFFRLCAFCRVFSRFGVHSLFLITGLSTYSGLSEFDCVTASALLLVYLVTL